MHACVCALETERSRTLRDSLAEAVFVAGFVPAGGESGGLMVSLMLCVDQGHGTVRAPGLGETREREREQKPRTQQLNHSSLIYSYSTPGTDLYLHISTVYSTFISCNDYIMNN